MSLNRRVDKQNVVHLYNTQLLENTINCEICKQKKIILREVTQSHCRKLFFTDSSHCCQACVEDYFEVRRNCTWKHFFLSVLNLEKEHFVLIKRLVKGLIHNWSWKLWCACLPGLCAHAKGGQSQPFLGNGSCFVCISWCLSVFPHFLVGTVSSADIACLQGYELRFLW